MCAICTLYNPHLGSRTRIASKCCLCPSTMIRKSNDETIVMMTTRDGRAKQQRRTPHHHQPFHCKRSCNKQCRTKQNKNCEKARTTACLTCVVIRWVISTSPLVQTLSAFFYLSSWQLVNHSRLAWECWPTNNWLEGNKRIAKRERESGRSRGKWSTGRKQTCFPLAGSVINKNIPDPVMYRLLHSSSPIDYFDGNKIVLLSNRICLISHFIIAK